MYLQCEPLRGPRKEKFTLVNSETLARDRTLINGKDARAFIDFAIVTFIVTFVLLIGGRVTVPSSGCSAGAFPLLNLD
jgi:hypothetical protein